MPRINNWSPEMYESLAALYPHHTNKELSAMTGWTVKEMQYRAHILGIVKTKDTERKGLTRVEYTGTQEAFIRENFNKYTNSELAALLGYSLDYIRSKCHGMGLFRMRLEYWTAEQVDFLKQNYRQIGDKELAEIFQESWPKQKTWTFKHIEKKRTYLKLKRNREEIRAILDRNVERGVFNPGEHGRWLDRGITKEGDIRMGRLPSGSYVPYIKIKGHFILWSRYTWEQHNGPVPAGYCVVFKNGPEEYIQGITCLKLATRSEMAAKMGFNASVQLSDNHVAYLLTTHQPELREAVKESPELLELKRQEILLKRKIRSRRDL